MVCDSWLSRKPWKLNTLLGAYRPAWRKSRRMYLVTGLCQTLLQARPSRPWQLASSAVHADLDTLCWGAHQDDSPAGRQEADTLCFILRQVFPHPQLPDSLLQPPQLLPGSPIPALALALGSTPAQDQVRWLQSSVQGCCNDHADNRACDCLATARRKDVRYDPATLRVLADALEESHYPPTIACPFCSVRDDCLLCRGTGNIPHPVLSHLRGPDTLRGCWSVALVTGELSWD